MNRIAVCLTLVGTLLVAACSEQDGTGNLLVEAGRGVFDQVRNIGEAEPGPSTPKVVTRQLLDATPGQVLEVIVEGSGQQDFLQLIATRDDGTPGRVEVWKSSDNGQVILREGVLVSTRGLGGDLQSSSAGATIAAFDGRGGGGERVMVFDRQDGTAQTVAFACDAAQLGAETIRIVDQRVPTYHIRETCVADRVRFINEYWVETAGGRMRQSRQWVGPTFGYVRMRRLKN